MSDPSAILSTVASLNTSAPALGSNLDAASAKKAGEDFEAFFLSQAFENMFSGVNTDPGIQQGRRPHPFDRHR